MKKLFIIAAVMMLVCTSCGTKAKKQQPVVSEQEKIEAQLADQQYLRERLDSLYAELQQTQFPLLMTLLDNGELKLSDKELKLKPDYLLPVTEAARLMTVAQKQRVVVIYWIDMKLAKSYHMPIDEYEKVISKLLMDINNPIVKQMMDMEPEQFVEDYYRYEQENNGSSSMFWEMMMVTTVENIYLTTKLIDKLMPYFTDESAAALSHRFAICLDAIGTVAKYDPRKKELFQLIWPLKRIDAVNKTQLYIQLKGIEGDMEGIRNRIIDFE